MQEDLATQALNREHLNSKNYRDNTGLIGVKYLGSSLANGFPGPVSSVNCMVIVATRGSKFQIRQLLKANSCQILPAEK